MSINKELMHKPYTLTDVEIRIMDMAADIGMRNGAQGTPDRVRILAESLKIVIAQLRAERAVAGITVGVEGVDD